MEKGGRGNERNWTEGVEKGGEQNEREAGRVRRREAWGADCEGIRGKLD